MKKIFAFLIALLIAINILSFNSIKANAVALPASVLSYLIEACYTLIVGSGTVSQSEFDSMNTSEVFDTTNSLLPSIDLESNAKLKADFITKFNDFLNDAISKQLDFITGDGLSSYVDAYSFYDFINGHVDDLETSYDDSILEGYGCYITVINTRTYPIQELYYGDYGVINSNKDSQIFSSTGIREKVISDINDPNITNYNRDNVTSWSSYTVNFRDDNIIQYFGDWRFEDGTSASDLTTALPETISSIGTVDVDGATYDVSGDGTVTIGDTTYTINDDGSITINGDTYYPTYDVTPYDDTAIIDLLGQILNQIQVKEDAASDELIEEAEIEVPIEISNSELSSLTLPKSIATVFPFCIPWDFYNGIKLLSQQPKAPRFEVPFEIPEFGLFPGYKKMIVLDFSEYESAFYVVRWVTFALFMFGLCFITFKIVKGA